MYSKFTIFLIMSQSKNMHQNSISEDKSVRIFEGFSLLELLVVIAIIAILSSLTVGRYNRYIEQSNRRAVIAQLYAMQQTMERSRLQTGEYAQQPTSNVAGYQITTVANGSVYHLVATPQEKGGDMQCGTLSIDQLDVRQVANGMTDECWR